MRLKNRIILATPLICTIIYLTIGFTIDMWHPTWAVFFLILIVPEILDENFLSHIYPTICLITYVTLGITLNLWHPAWIIFLSIPVYYIIFGPIIRKHRIKYIKEEPKKHETPKDKFKKIFEFTID